MRSSVPTPERANAFYRVAAYTADAEYRNTRVVQALHALLAKQQLGSRKMIEQVFSPFRAVFRLVISIAGNAYCVNRKLSFPAPIDRGRTAQACSLLTGGRFSLNLSGGCALRRRRERALTPRGRSTRGWTPRFPPSCESPLFLEIAWRRFPICDRCEKGNGSRVTVACLSPPFRSSQTAYCYIRLNPRRRNISSAAQFFFSWGYPCLNSTRYAAPTV